MKLIDRIALNRLISMICDLIISIVKICQKKDTDSNPSPVNRPRPIIDFLKKKIKR
jgi:hypothetical protein